MTWREEVSDKAQGDLDALFTQAALLAQTLLMRNREFYPFGAVMSSRGTVGLSTPAPAGDHPSSADVLNAIRDELTGAKTKNRAYAVAAMAVMPDGAEGVRVELEHKEGLALVVGLAVRRDDAGAVSFGEMRSLRAEPRVWAPRAAGERAAAKSSAAPKPSAAPKSKATRGAAAAASTRSGAKSATSSAPRSTSAAAKASKRSGGSSAAGSSKPRTRGPVVATA